MLLCLLHLLGAQWACMATFVGTRMVRGPVGHCKRGWRMYGRLEHMGSELAQHQAFIKGIELPVGAAPMAVAEDVAGTAPAAAGWQGSSCM